MKNSDAVFVHDALARISAKLMQRQKKFICRDFEQLTFSEARALRALKDGAVKNMRTVAGLLGVAVSTATTSIDRLVAKKLVSRRVSDDDRRQWLVQLTPAAGELVRSMEAQAIAGTEKFLEQLSGTEVKFLKAILNKIDNNL